METEPRETLLECEARLTAGQTTPPARRCPHCIGRIHPPDCQGGPDFLPKGGRLIPIRPVKAAQPALEGPARQLKSPSHTR